MFGGSALRAQRSYAIEIPSTQPPLLLASAGDAPMVVGSDWVLGDMPAASGGTAPWTYQWLPETDLNDATLANPIYSGTSSASYTLVVTDSRGCTARDTLDILITASSDKEPEADFRLYPNPGSGSIRLEAPSHFDLHNTTIQLSDASGRLVYSGRWQEEQAFMLLTVHDWSKGHYTLTLSDGRQSLSRKLILN